MALWQMSALAVLAVIAVLIGTLLVYARILTNKIGKTNATLRRIEEALITANSLKGHLAPAHAQASAGLAHGFVNVTHGLGGGPPVSSEVMPRSSVRPHGASAVAMPPIETLASGAPNLGTPTEPSDPAPSIPVPDTDRRISYLTVRDLKVISRSASRSNDPAVGMNPFTGEPIVRRRRAGADPAVESAEATEAIADSGLAESVSSHAEVSVGNTERIYATFDEQLHTRLDGLESCGSGLSSRSAVIEELVAATSQMREVLDEGGAPHEVQTELDAPVHVSAHDMQSDMDASLHAMGREDVQPDFSASVSAASPEAAAGAASEEQPGLGAQFTFAAPEFAATVTADTDQADTTAVTIEERLALTAEIRATAIASAEEQPAEASVVLDPDPDADADAEKRRRHIELMAVAHRRRRRARH